MTWVVHKYRKNNIQVILMWILDDQCPTKYHRQGKFICKICDIIVRYSISFHQYEVHQKVHIQVITIIIIYFFGAIKQQNQHNRNMMEWCGRIQCNFMEVNLNLFPSIIPINIYGIACVYTNIHTMADRWAVCFWRIFMVAYRNINIGLCNVSYDNPSEYCTNI